jgi:hypothetical protein
MCACGSISAFPFSGNMAGENERVVKASLYQALYQVSLNQIDLFSRPIRRNRNPQKVVTTL